VFFFFFITTSEANKTMLTKSIGPSRD